MKARSINFFMLFSTLLLLALGCSGDPDLEILAKAGTCVDCMKKNSPCCSVSGSPRSNALGDYLKTFCMSYYNSGGISCSTNEITILKGAADAAGSDAIWKDFCSNL